MTGENYMSARLQTLSISRLNRLRQQELVGRHVLRLIFLGLTVLSLAGLLYLTQASAVTTTTYEIEELQNERQRLQREADRLRAEIAMLTTPEQIRERALALGFQPAQPADFLAVAEIPAVERPVQLADEVAHPATPFDVLVNHANNWLHAVVGLMPATSPVEAGPAVHE